jgi:WD40 repeat protein
MRDLDSAIADYTKAIQLIADRDVALKESVLLNRGRAYDSKKDYDRAIADFSELIRTTTTEDKHKWMHFLDRALVYDRKGEPSLAIADFNEALRLSPNEPYIRSLKGHFCKRNPSISGCNRQSESEAITVLLGQGTYGAVFSPDGRRIVTYGSSGASIWDAETGKQLAVLKAQLKEGHKHLPYYVLGAAFSSDGTRVVTADIDKTARIWDAASGKEIVVLDGHGGDVKIAAFSPDGARVVTASEDKTARIWDAASGKEIVVLRGHDREVNNAAFSPDGRRVLTASGDSTARIWDAKTGKASAVLRWFNDEKYNVQVYKGNFSPDGRRVMTVDGSGASVWDAETGKQIIRLDIGSHMHDAELSPDGRRVVTGSTYYATIWDAETGKEIVVLRAYDKDMINVAVMKTSFSRDGRLVVTASEDDFVRIWDAETGKVITSLKGPEHSIPGSRSHAISPDAQRVVTVSAEFIARMWRLPQRPGLTDKTK